MKSERKIQTEVASYLDKLGLLWCHVPNGEKRSKRTGWVLKLAGVKPGVPDVLIFTEPRTAIELKTEKGRVSKVQREWLANLKAEGWQVFVAYSTEEAKEVINDVYGF